MAGSMSNYLAYALLRHAFKTADYTPPAHIYLGLYTVAPDDDGGGTEVPNTNGYVRQVVDDWTPFVTSPRRVKNTNVITFPAATPVGWGDVEAWGLLDSLASGSGNLLWWGDGLVLPVPLNYVVEILAGQIEVTLT